MSHPGPSYFLAHVHVWSRYLYNVWHFQKNDIITKSQDMVNFMYWGPYNCCLCILFNGAWPVYLVCVLLVSILWFTIQLSAIYTCTSADCIKLYIIHLNPMTINFCVTHSLTVAVKFCVIHLMTVKFCVILIDCINSVLYPCTQWLCLLPHTALTVNFVSYTQWLCQVLCHTALTVKFCVIYPMTVKFCVIQHWL